MLDILFSFLIPGKSGDKSEIGMALLYVFPFFFIIEVGVCRSAPENENNFLLSFHLFSLLCDLMYCRPERSNTCARPHQNQRLFWREAHRAFFEPDWHVFLSFRGFEEESGTHTGNLPSELRFVLCHSYG